MKKTAALMIFIVSASLLCACAAKKGADITVKTEMKVDRSTESDSGAGTIKEVEITSGNEVAKQEGEEMQSGFEDYPNIEVSGIEKESLTEEQMEILQLQARYCQAMTEADTDTMRELVSEDMTYTHMSGKTQTREEYFADIEKGRLNYYTIGIENPIIKVDGDTATIEYIAKQEQNDNARPEYAGEVPDLSAYDTIYIGAPVWWGDWPMIMYTFFEQNAEGLSGKKLVPFSTHEGSGLSGFDRKLESACPDSTILEGLAIRGNDCQNKQDSVRSEVSEWISGIEE